MKSHCKALNLQNGSIEGWRWTLLLTICEKTKVFGGNFTFSFLDSLAIVRRDLRRKDRKIFEIVLGEKYMKDKIVHHDWDNGARVYLLNIGEHNKGALGVKHG